MDFFPRPPGESQFWPFYFHSKRTSRYVVNSVTPAGTQRAKPQPLATDGRVTRDCFQLLRVATVSRFAACSVSNTTESSSVGKSAIHYLWLPRQGVLYKTGRATAIRWFMQATTMHTNVGAVIPFLLCVFVLCALRRRASVGLFMRNVETGSAWDVRQKV